MKTIVVTMFAFQTLFNAGIYLAYWWHINGKGSSEHAGRKQ